MMLLVSIVTTTLSARCHKNGAENGSFAPFPISFQNQMIYSLCRILQQFFQFPSQPLEDTLA